MRVLLRWFFWLFGVMLLGITGGLFALRPNPPHDWLLFQSEQSIYRIRADGRQQKELTSHAAPDIFEAWSLAGDWLILRRQDSAGRENLYRMRPDGSELKALTEHQYNAWFQAWSPDGQWIIYRAASAGSWNLFRMRVNGGRAHQLTHSLGDSSVVTLSPDAQWLTYNTNSTFIEFNRMRPDGGQIRNITNRRHFSFQSWLPDGQWMIFQSAGDNRGANTDLYRIRLDGAALQNLTRTPETHDRFESLSPDGEWIIFSSLLAHQNSLHRMQIDGSETQQLTYLSDAITFETWSPDGGWILYTNTVVGHSNLYRMRADGSDNQRLTHMEGSNVFLGFSPGGRWIIFSSRGAAGVDFFRMGADGGQPDIITSDGYEKRFLGFSPDGEWIIYQTDALYRVRLDGSAAQQLTNTPGENHFIGWQPTIDIRWRAWMSVLAGVVFVIFWSMIRVRPHTKGRT